MKLRPYIADLDFEKIKNWMTDERAHVLWCANRFQFPLKRENMDAVLKEHAVQYKDSPFVATSDKGDVIGFFCYGLNEEKNEGMLKFVAVAPHFRGKGVGREMVAMAVRYGFDITQADTIRLSVFSENPAAKRCYQAVGFAEQTFTENAFRFQGEAWGRCGMAIRRKD